MNAHQAAAGLPGARGMIFIHSTPAALCPHLEWAAASVLGPGAAWHWTDQPAEPGTRRAEISWAATTGTGSRLASVLGEFAQIRFEVTEDASPGCEGTRFYYTPALGRFTATVGVHGDVMVPEDRIRHAMVQTAGDPLLLRDALDGLIGTAWDEELEEFRYGSEDAPIRWLHQVV